jgi:hypothetical protein
MREDTLMAVKSAETRSHYSYKQRPQTKEWRTNYDSIFRPGLTMEKVQKAAALMKASYQNMPVNLESARYIDKLVKEAAKRRKP